MSVIAFILLGSVVLLPAGPPPDQAPVVTATPSTVTVMQPSRPAEIPLASQP